MYKLRAKVLISKKPSCNCGGFYHPGEVFVEANEAVAKQYIANNQVDVLESPIMEAKEEKIGRKTKELKA